jgi:hypothetical protein
LDVLMVGHRIAWIRKTAFPVSGGRFFLWGLGF